MLRAGRHATTFAPKSLIKTGRRRNARGSIARHVRSARALRLVRRLRTPLAITTIITMCTPNLLFSVRRRRTDVKVFVLKTKRKPGRRNAHGLIVRRVGNAMVSRNVCPFLLFISFFYFLPVPPRSHLLGSSMTSCIAPHRTRGHGSYEGCRC